MEMHSTGELGRVYEAGEWLIRQGESADCMFVIQEGEVEILKRHGDEHVRLAVRGSGEIIGEMAIFERQARSAGVRCLGRVRVLTVDRKNFLRRVHEDPSLAYRVVQSLSRRVRELSDEIAPFKRTGADQ